MKTYAQNSWPWAWYSRSNNALGHKSAFYTMQNDPPRYLLFISPQLLHTIQKYHTGLLNISLLDAAATPVGILATFCLHAGTPLTVNGSGTGTDDVSVTPTRLTSKGAGGLIVIEAVAVSMGMAGSEGGYAGVCGEVFVILADSREGWAAILVMWKQLC